MTSNAKHLREFRARRRRGVIVAPVELSARVFTAALIRRGVLKVDRTLSRNELSTYAASVLQMWAGEEKERT